MATPKRAIRATDEEWTQLTALAAELVRDDEMPRDAVPGAGRAGQMIRMIADGRLRVTRADRAGEPALAD